MEPDDDELIRRARDGEAAAYGMLVERHQEVAFRTAFAVCGDAGEAEDATQEAFLKAHTALARFRPGAPWRPWLLRIVANEARNRKRSEGRRRRLVVLAARGGLEAPPPKAPDVTALLHAQRGELAAALARLEPPHREVVVLRHFLELSEAECAAVLGCRPGTVKSRLSRVSLAEAERRAGFRLVLPRALGRPDQVRVRGGIVTLIYDSGATLLAQLPGRLGAELVEKVVRGDTAVRRVPGGIFISGPEHSYLYIARDGEVAQDRPFLAAETLIVQRGGLLLRLERRGLTPDRALALLGSR